MSEFWNELEALATDHARHLVAAIVLVCLWTAEALIPLHLGRSRRLSHAGANVGLALINAVVFQGAGFALVWATAWGQRHQVGLMSFFPLPPWASWFAAILLIDGWQYFWHRINHRLPFLWRFHAVHHADAEMDATSALRFHSGEIGLSFLVRLVILPLLGVTVPQLLLYEAISLPVILFHHSNIRLTNNQDRWLRWLLVTPWMHQVHHSHWQPETDSNYSSFLSIWDRLFGSFRLNADPALIRLGLEGWAEADWRSLPGMLLRPFRRRLPSSGKSVR